MRILLDTCIVLWAAAGTLPPTAVRYIEDETNTLLFSAVSIWEIVIKRSLNRPDFILDPTCLYNELLRLGYKELPLTARHTLLFSSLPVIHKDPFDRILLAQAVYEGIPLLTADRVISQYPGSIIYVGGMK
jgi:PIN domain nuclease of toxin-antitoxin system